MSYLSTLKKLFPPGKIFSSDSENFNKIIDGLDNEFERIKLSIFEMLQDAFPDSTTNMISDWENTLALPDAANPETDLTNAESRIRIISKLIFSGDQSENFYSDQATKINITITIERHPYTPFVSGSLCGTPLYGNEWRFVWRVNILSASDADYDLIVAKFRSYTQSHTAIEFVRNYPGDMQSINLTLFGSGVNLVSMASNEDELLLCVGEDEIYNSTNDGLGFNIMTLPSLTYSNEVFNSACFGNGEFVVVGGSNDGSGNSTSEIMYADELDIEVPPSPGTAFSSVSSVASAYSGEFSKVVFGNNVFVAIGSGGKVYVGTSGSVWPTNYTDTDILNIVFNGTYFFAVGNNKLKRSTDGINWTTLDSDFDHDSIIGYNGEGLVAVDSGSPSVYAVSIDDGVTWTEYNVYPGSSDFKDAGGGFGYTVLVGTLAGSPATYRGFWSRNNSETIDICTWNSYLYDYEVFNVFYSNEAWYTCGEKTAINRSQIITELST